MLRGLLQA